MHIHQQHWQLLSIVVCVIFLVLLSTNGPHSIRITHEIEILRDSSHPVPPHYDPSSAKATSYTQFEDKTSEQALSEHAKSRQKPGTQDQDALPPSDLISIYGNDFNGLPELCDKTRWTEGLWIHCHNHCGPNLTSVCGGLNNARNRIQTCLRFAIDIGAGIIIPTVTLRNEISLEIDFFTANTVCADEFWDIEYLRTRLALQCPQLQVRGCDDRSGIDSMDVVMPRPATSIAYHVKGTFRNLVDEALAAVNRTFDDVSIERPLIIASGETFMRYSYAYAGELTTIRRALFKLLRFNKNLLDISDQILENPKLQNGDYIGIHLRGEGDWPAKRGGIEIHIPRYMDEIRKIRNNLTPEIKTVYVSCGNLTAIDIFRKKLEPEGFVVHDKATLLDDEPETLAKVNALAFDMKAIVEYQVLLEAKYFMGPLISTMSSLIAFARTVDDPEDLFERYIHPGSKKHGLYRIYRDPFTLKGDETTKLLVYSDVDLMHAFP